MPQKTAAYISQQDFHIPDMTVRETLDFSSCCQGVGSRSGTRFREQNILPEVNIDNNANRSANLFRAFRDNDRALPEGESSRNSSRSRY